MKKGKTIFLIVYLAFHVVLLVGAIVVNLRSEDFEFLFSVRDNMASAVWFAVLGLLLFIINIIMISLSTRNHEKQEEKLRQEVNSLKAKVYDLQDVNTSSGTSITTGKQPKTPPADENSHQ
jgi:ABC-type transport system involved in cytochrome bd biosynthesis fused ATPase/permease subunit